MIFVPHPSLSLSLSPSHPLTLSPSLPLSLPPPLSLSVSRRRFRSDACSEARGSAPTGTCCRTPPTWTCDTAACCAKRVPRAMATAAAATGRASSRTPSARASATARATAARGWSTCSPRAASTRCAPHLLQRASPPRCPLPLPRRASGAVPRARRAARQSGRRAVLSPRRAGCRVSDAGVRGRHASGGPCGGRLQPGAGGSGSGSAVCTAPAGQRQST
jgi:hypothetical protein